MKLPFRRDDIPLSHDHYRWEVLGTYNAEVQRGIVHTPEYDKLMALEQVTFDLEMRERARREGAIITERS